MKTLTKSIKANRNKLAMAFLVALCFGVYINILPNPFIWSEEAVVVNNPTFKNLSYLPRFFTKDYWLKEHPFSGTSLFRPMRAVTFTVEYALWGLNPTPYHLFNITLHAATTILVFLIFKKITKNFLLGLLTALFFAAHPAHTETIDWTMSRDDIMCTLFPLISWWFFIKRTQAKIKTDDTDRSSLFNCSIAPLLNKNNLKRLGYLGLEMLFFTLGLLSREMASVFPLLLVLYVLCFLPRKRWKRELLATVPYWILDAGYAFFHFFYFWEGLTKDRLNPDIVPPLPNHILLVAKTIGFYLKLLIAPLRLSADHYFPIGVTIAERDTQLLVGLFLITLALSIILYKRQRWLSFSLLFTILAFAPVSNIIIVTGRPVGEQRIYLPSIGFCFLTALVLQKLARNYHQVLLPLLALPLVGCYSYKTFQRNYDWRSPLALWESSVAVSPQTERAHRNLSGAYLANEMEDKAIEEFETILRIEEEERKKHGVKTVYKSPGVPAAYLTPILPIRNERKMFELRQRMEKEERERMVNPNAEIHYFLGEAYRKRKGDLKRAAYEYNMAIILDPVNFEAYNGLGITYDMAGFSEAAIFILEKGTKINPDFYPLWHNLGIAYEHAERWEDAIKSYKKVLEIAPDYDQPHLRLTIIYAKYKIDKERAKDHWQKYLELTCHPDPIYLKEFEYLEEEVS